MASEFSPEKQALIAEQERLYQQVDKHFEEYSRLANLNTDVAANRAKADTHYQEALQYQDLARGLTRRILNMR